MTLREYVRKRRFDKTPEPRAGRVATSERPMFVVQLHHASRRHYDFRLQVGDALKSWAVPKGPSFDPKVKRLAVEVEDHPVSYGGFQGDIPEGYGKGHVDIFDSGVWSTAGDAEEQLQKGHLRFELFGQRLRGGWHLVRSSRKERKPAWFLIKEKDEFVSVIEADDLLDSRMVESTIAASGKSGGAAEVARKLKSGKRMNVPASKAVRQSRTKRGPGVGDIEGARKAESSGEYFEPQLARLREAPPRGEAWVHEVKWDGYRILGTVHAGDVRLWSRNAKAWTEKLPDIVAAIASLELTSARLDGELIALTDGKSDFNALQQTLSGERASPLAYVLFDAPYLEGFDLSRSPLTARKEALSQVLGAQPPAHLLFSSHVVGNGDEVFLKASEQKLEGIMCKRADSPYRGGRGDDWLKVKRLEADEFAVVGWTEAKGSRAGFGALLLALPTDVGTWRYVGRLGTGFDTEQLLDLRKKLTKSKALRTKVDHTDEAPKGAHWVEPSLVAEAYYRGIGNHGLLRQASLKTMRADKSPADLRGGDRTATRVRATKPASLKEKDTAGVIAITHPDRVVYPADGFTKQDVADYYQAVMEWFLPGVLQRPISVIRYPRGIDQQSFFQKHLPMGGLKRVGATRLKEETGASGIYIYPESSSSVMELVQYNAIEFHPWGSHVESPDDADRIIFDFDPGPEVIWKRVVDAARLARKLLGDVGLESFVRTTGGKGLHVVVPLRPANDWGLVRRFAEGFARAMAGAHPMDFVSTMTKSQRRGKIFVDYFRNGRGATAIASYSLRGRPGAPVAVPLRWEELTKIKSGAQFNIKTTIARLKKQNQDPWAGIDEINQNLDDLARKLG